MKWATALRQQTEAADTTRDEEIRSDIRSRITQLQQDILHGNVAAVSHTLGGLMHSDFDCPAQQRGGHQLDPHGPWCFCLGGVPAWLAFTGRAQTVVEPTTDSGASLGSSHTALDKTQTPCRTTDAEGVNSQEDWYGVEEAEDEDFDPVLAKRAQLEAAHRACARLERNSDDGHAGTPSSSCRTEKRKRNSAAGSPHSAGRRISKESLYSRTPLSTIEE